MYPIDKERDNSGANQFQTPGSGGCFFGAVALSYLIPVKDDE
ncbi:hypothetical protein [Wolbachia endosymbiont (group B) of Athalia cordata]|nr:hypothetical protein [Wolbachia endosymbiont (group B) of Athalia cordata]